MEKLTKNHTTSKLELVLYAGGVTRLEIFIMVMGYALVYCGLGCQILAVKLENIYNKSLQPFRHYTFFLGK